MATLPPQSQKWPADRALLLVHGIGNARPGDYNALVAQITNILAKQDKQYAIYVFYYDQVNNWFADKGSAPVAVASLVNTVRSLLPSVLDTAAGKVDATALGNVVADFAGDVIWPVLLFDARDAVRTALIRQIQQIVLDGKQTGIRQPMQHLSIIAHSMGCFHTFEALHAAANSTSQGLAPATDGVQYDNVIYMASPVQLIRTVGRAIRAFVPRPSDVVSISAPELVAPGEDDGTGNIIPSAKRTISVVGNLDPVGGYFFRDQLPWAYMDLPKQMSFIDKQEWLDIKQGELQNILQTALSEHAAPSLTPENPHDWSAYVARHASDLQQWLGV
jgi:hypothetical protein